MKVSANAYFTIVPEWLLDADVTDRAFRVYALLSRYADESGASHPSRSTLARRLACSVDSVDRALKELELVGAVEVKRRIKNGAYETNEYVVDRKGGRTVAARGRGSRAA